MQPIHCGACGAITPSHDIINYGSLDQGYRQLCTLCFNADVAKRCGLEDFENLRFESIGVTDCTGEPHQFHFQTRLMGNIVVMEAFELQDGCPAG